jgi:hypothetical protein
MLANAFALDTSARAKTFKKKLVSNKVHRILEAFRVPCSMTVERVKREAGDSDPSDIPAQPPLL